MLAKLIKFVVAVAIVSAIQYWIDLYICTTFNF